MGSIQLGDARRNQRMVKVFSQMLNSPGKSIHQCSRSVAKSKAFYRLLDVEELTDTLLLDIHRQAVLRRDQHSGCRVLLAIQDTTECNFNTLDSLEGLGSISSNKLQPNIAGLLVHSNLLSAADEDASLGFWVPSSTPASLRARSAARGRESGTHRGQGEYALA